VRNALDPQSYERCFSIMPSQKKCDGTLKKAAFEAQELGWHTVATAP
jgi:hypothetical protein